LQGEARSADASHRLGGRRRQGAAGRIAADAEPFGIDTEF